MQDDLVTASAASSIPGKIRRHSWESLARSFAALFRRNNNIYKLFFSLCKKLNKLFSLSTAVLVVHSVRDNSLKVIAVKNSKHSPEGISLTLPDQDSLLHSVFNDGSLHIDNSLEHFSGNFFEKKLLLGEEANSLAIIPINHDGNRIGLFCLASPRTNAFDLLDESLLRPVTAQFGEVLAVAVSDLNL